MKTNRILIISIIIFLCLVCLILGSIGYFYFANQPPNQLSDSGYYIRLTKVYYYPGFGISEPFEIQGADKNSFVIINTSFALDASNVYFQGNPIPEADPQTFRVLNENYHCSVDVNHAYQRDNIIPNVDPKTIPSNATVTYCSPDEILFTP